MRDYSIYVSQYQVEDVWPHIKHYISRCDSEVSTSEDLLPLLVNGSRLLFVTIRDSKIRGACIVRIVHGFEKIFRITTLGGDGVDWDSCMIDAEKAALQMGCTKIEVQGRRGWLKALSGYEEKYTTIGKNLCGEELKDTSPS